jgi:hypothetical protein
MIAISATLQNWGNFFGKTCCQQVRSSFVSFPFSFVSLSSSLVSPSLFTPSAAAAAAAPPHPLHSIYLRSNSKIHIHSANEEE